MLTSVYTTGSACCIVLTSYTLHRTTMQDGAMQACAVKTCSV